MARATPEVGEQQTAVRPALHASLDRLLQVGARQAFVRKQDDVLDRPDDLLGGAHLQTGGRAEVRAYASLMRYGNPRTVRSICERMIQNGFSHVKLHEHTVEAVAAAARR